MCLRFFLNNTIAVDIKAPYQLTNNIKFLTVFIFHFFLHHFCSFSDDGFEQGLKRAKYKKRCYKRKIYTKAEKQSIMGKLKHPVLPGCESKCSKKCSLKISEEQRNRLHETYWDIVDRRERKFWMSKHIKQMPVKKRTFIFSKREGTCLYFLPLSPNDSEEVSVCQKFFLTTFGFTHCHIIKSVKNAYSFEELPLPEKEYKEDKRKGPRKRASSSEVMVTSKLETEEDLLYGDSNRASSDSHQLQSENGVKKEFLGEFARI